MTRQAFIEMVLRNIYGDQPSSDANITPNLVNVWLDQAIGVAAKANYKDNIALDGVSYVNNSFYSTFSGIAITNNGNQTWKLTLPQIPVGVGSNMGVSTLQITDATGQITNPLIPITENQRTYYQRMRQIPNKILYYYQGNYAYILSPLILSGYTATVTMISGGNSNDLTSNLNVPFDYFPIMIEYIKNQLVFQRNIPQDVTNDGLDAVTTT